MLNRLFQPSLIIYSHYVDLFLYNLIMSKYNIIKQNEGVYFTLFVLQVYYIFANFILSCLEMEIGYRICNKNQAYC